MQFFFFSSEGGGAASAPATTERKAAAAPAAAMLEDASRRSVAKDRMVCAQWCPQAVKMRRPPPHSRLPGTSWREGLGATTVARSWVTTLNDTRNGNV